MAVAGGLRLPRAESLHHTKLYITGKFHYHGKVIVPSISRRDWFRMSPLGTQNRHLPRHYKPRALLVSAFFMPPQARCVVITAKVVHWATRVCREAATVRKATVPADREHLGYRADARLVLI